MNFIDKTISMISPKIAAERMAWRIQLELAEKSYDAGNFGRRNSGWAAWNESGEITDRTERDVIRARARDLERNSDMSNAIVLARIRNTVGKGFTLQSKTDDNDINNEIEELWKQWCKAKNCDVTGTQNFMQILRMAVRRKTIDGGFIIIKCYTNGGLIPFKLQCIEVDELYSYQTAPNDSKNKVVGGIEYNEFNKAVGYWFQQYSQDGMSLNNPKFFNAKDVIFYFRKTRPSQIREISELAPTISRIRDTNEFVDAVSMKERIAACLSVFITRKTPQNQIGRGSSLQDSKSYDGKKLSPGMITELSPGDSIEVVNPGNTANESEAFLKTQQRIMAAGQGMSYEVVSRDMSQTNYSSARQGLIEDEATFFEEIEQLKEVIMDEVYETFLISCILAGLISIKDFWQNKTKYMKHIWVPMPKKWIDPAKEANANKIALASNQKSYLDVWAESGKDWQETIDEMAKIEDYAKKKGISLGGGTNVKIPKEGNVKK